MLSRDVVKLLHEPEAYFKEGDYRFPHDSDGKAVELVEAVILKRVCRDD